MNYELSIQNRILKLNILLCDIGTSIIIDMRPKYHTTAWQHVKDLKLPSIIVES